MFRNQSGVQKSKRRLFLRYCFEPTMAALVFKDSRPPPCTVCSCRVATLGRVSIVFGRCSPALERSRELIALARLRGLYGRIDVEKPNESSGMILLSSICHRVLQRCA
jgi:hypothetical protein